MKPQKAEAEATLLERGLEPETGLALMLPTSPDYFRSFAGILLAGGVPVPIYPPFRPAQLQEHVHRRVGILGNCRAAYLVTTGDLDRVGGLLREQVASRRGVLAPAELASDGRAPAPGLAAQDTGLLQYTSGSTARPKGVVLSHANLLANVRAIGRADSALLLFPEGAFDRMPGLLPFHMGARLVAAHNRLPLVPIAIRGTRSMLRPEVWLPRAGRIRITMGEPLRPPDDVDDWSAAVALRDAARPFNARESGEALLDDRA